VASARSAEMGGNPARALAATTYAEIKIPLLVRRPIDL
jgi:hypothetical protein